MIIETISQRYRVVRRPACDSRIEAYICVREGCPPEQMYLLLGLTGTGLPKGLNAYFLKLAEGGERDGGPECFTRNGCLWLVFPYRDELSLSEKAEKDLPLRERLEIGRSLMEQMVRERFPAYLLYEALRPDNVAVSDVPEVFFNFLLTEPDEYECCGLLQVQRRLAGCLALLFTPELEEGLVPELEDFIRELAEEEEEGYFAIYRRYLKLYNRMKDLLAAGELRKKPLVLRIWKKIRGSFTYLKKVLAVAVVAALAAVLVWLIRNPKQADEGHIPFIRIGTLGIRQEERENSAEGIRISAVETSEEAEEGRQAGAGE